MSDRRPIVVIAAFFVIVQLLAIVFMAFALTSEDQAVEDPNDPMFALYYIVLMLAFTGLFLILLKYGLQRAMKAIFYGSVGFVIFYVVIVLLRWLIEDQVLVLVLAGVIAALCIVLLLKHPEWYIIDVLGVVMAIGIIAILGISLSIIPVLLILIALAIYDFISVYKTKHMLKLAEGVGDMSLPLLLIVPKKLPYSHLEKKLRITQEASEPGKKPEREAFFIGLGDIIIPGLLQASAFWFLPDEGYSLLGVPANLAVAIFTVVGGVVGLLILMRIVQKGDPQAGLPLLNTGTILGFLISYMAVFGLDYSFMIPG